MKLIEVSYETFLRYQNDVEDLLPDKEGGEEDSDLNSDGDENPADVAFSHNIRENCHPPKSSGPLVHFSQTSCKRMPYR